MAYHVRLVPWQEKDRPGRYNQKMLKLFESYFMDVVLPVPVEKMVKISKCYTWNEDTFGLGDRGCDIEDKEFDFKLSMSNVFDWVMDEFNKLLDFKTINITSRYPFSYYSHMEFPSKVTYATFDLGNLSKLVKGGAKDNVRVSVFTKDDDAYDIRGRVSQTVVKIAYEDLMDSAKNDDSMAFMRYTFADNQIWDREIDITKHIWAKAKDQAEKVKTASKNAGEWAKSVVDSDYTRKTYSAKYDPFEGMIILFKTEPDFKKRKNPHVCGY